MTQPWSWQQASFRGVPFKFRTAGATIGRRNVVHVYPGRDDVYVEDLCRKGREFFFEAFVIGDEADNYMGWRDKLERACEAIAGPGELVHPTRGRVRVSVADCRPSENIDERGLAGFSLAFIESGSVELTGGPAARVDTPAVVAAAAQAATAAAVQDFAAPGGIGQLPGFAVVGLPPFVAADALATITGALDAITATVQGMLPDMTLLPALNDAARSVTDRLTGLMRIPTDLAAELTDQVAGLQLVALAPMSAFNALRNLFGFDGDLAAAGAYSPRLHDPMAAIPPMTNPALATPARLAQIDNRTAVQNLVRRAALIEAARAVSGIKFPTRAEAQGARVALAKARADYARIAPGFSTSPASSGGSATGTASSGGGATSAASTEAQKAQAALIEATAAAARVSYLSRAEALALRDDLADRLEAAAESSSDPVYHALLDLRTAVVEDIGARSIDLPNRVSYTPRATQPSLVLAWRLYGDPEMEADIAARNRVRHPGFVPGGRALEVLL